MKSFKRLLAFYAASFLIGTSMTSEASAEQCTAKLFADGLSDAGDFVSISNPENPLKDLSSAVGCDIPSNFQPWKGTPILGESGQIIGSIGDLLLTPSGEPKYLSMVVADGQEIAAIPIDKFSDDKNNWAILKTKKLSPDDISAFGDGIVLSRTTGLPQKVYAYAGRSQVNASQISGAGLNPYGGMIAVHFLSTPAGATVELSGKRISVTEGSAWVKDVRTSDLKMSMNGYETCASSSKSYKPSQGSAYPSAEFECILKKSHSE